VERGLDVRFCYGTVWTASGVGCVRLSGVPTLTLCVVARDEEAGLPLALASARPYADEVLVAVDSRTRDRTREVAREAAPEARVVDVVFEDFAQMRNAALRLVRTDWVLMLDADEVLEGDPRPLLERRAIWEFPRRHWADLGRTVPSPDDRFYPDRQGRLFPNDPALHFERPVHEVARGFRRRFTDSVVIHHLKHALRSTETIEERRRLYLALVEKGRAAGFRFRTGKDDQHA
jgi:glycosyltransferase involved in cell wall biosynthesis